MADNRRGGRVTVRRPRPTQTTQQLANLSNPYTKAARDWGYPRTSPRPWHNTNQPDNTLSSNLTAFFGRTARNANNTLASRMQGSRETELFKSGARQVEDAVTALGERRQELQRDVCQLEAVKIRHLQVLTKHWKRLKGDVRPFRHEMETLVDRLSKRQIARGEASPGNFRTSRHAPLAKTETVKLEDKMQDFSFKGADTSKHQTMSKPAPDSKHELPAFTVKSPTTQERSQKWDLDIGGKTAQRHPATARQTYAVDSDEEASLKREIATLREEVRRGQQDAAKAPRRQLDCSTESKLRQHGYSTASAVQGGSRAARDVVAPPDREATADYGLWKQEAQEAAAEVASLEKQLDKEARRRKQMERQLAAMQSLQDQLDQKEQEVSSLGSELRAAKAMLEDKSVEAEALRESLRSAQRRIQSRDQDVGALNQQLDSLHNRLREMAQNAKQESAASQRLRQRLEDCTEALLAGMQEQHKEQEAENAALLAKVAELQQQLASERRRTEMLSGSAATVPSNDSRRKKSVSEGAEGSVGAPILPVRVDQPAASQQGSPLASPRGADNQMLLTREEQGSDKVAEQDSPCR